MAPTADDLNRALDLARAERGLAIVSTLRADLTIHSTLVNVGLLDHPGGGGPVLTFVTYGAVKLANLRARPQVTISFREGWRYATVEGTAELVGPADPHPAVAADGLRELLRATYRAAAGAEHEDWAEYDRVMAEQGRVVVLVHPTRVYGI